MGRSKEITAAFLTELDKHLYELKSGKAVSTFEIQDIAAILNKIF
jgi:AraC family transcriptional regulator, regulatory protein of adaptative response / methylphosphotriester-DNA alkyltransferase methyltransferase